MSSGAFHLDHIKRAAPQAATLLRADSLGRRNAAMNMRGRSPPGTPPLTAAGFFITPRLTGARVRYTFVTKAPFVTAEGNTRRKRNCIPLSRFASNPICTRGRTRTRPLRAFRVSAWRVVHAAAIGSASRRRKGPPEMSRKGFQPGHTGRPRGTRNKLAGRVFEDIFAHWCEPVAPGSNVRKGQEALQDLYTKNS